MTESEEMYLVSIARLEESGEAGPIPLSLLATDLSIQPVSVNQMVRKLEEEGWVSYTPYKGVDLTPRGQQLALQVLRHRRLWQVFLVERLRISEKEADELACRLEHFIPDVAAERLAAYLGHPTFSPLGLPIPAPEAVLPTSDFPLAILNLDEVGEITRLEMDSAGRTFLMAEGICPGAAVRVVGISGSGAVLLQNKDGHTIHLSTVVTKGVWVKKVIQR